MPDKVDRSERSGQPSFRVASNDSLITRIRSFVSDFRPSSFVYRRSSFVLRRFSYSDHIVTIELRQRLPLVAVLLALVWYLIAPGEVPAVLVFALAGMLAAAWLWARAMAREVVARRRLIYAAVQVGDVLEEHLSLDNQTALPVLWAEFLDHSDLPGYTASSVRAADPASSVHWHATAVCTTRGLFTLGPWELRLGDPFGIFLVRQVYTERQELLVYPPLAPLPPQLLPNNSLLGDHRRLRQPLRAETLSATTTRRYAPGDPLRHIHWPTSARREALYTKIFEPEATSTIWLVPDLDPSVHLGQGPDSTEETMVLLMASLADHLLRRGLAVGMMAQAAEVHALRPQSGRAQVWQVLRALAPIHATSPYPLEKALARLGASLPARDRVVVITPSIDTHWTQALRSLAHRSGIEAILLDPESFGGQGRADVAVQALADQGVAARALRRGELRPASGTYGQVRRWEFRTLGTGRAVARQTPRGVEAARKVMHG
jgi:uncharacterized protein (DUF58 family)